MPFSLIAITVSSYSVVKSRVLKKPKELYEHLVPKIGIIFSQVVSNYNPKVYATTNSTSNVNKHLYDQIEDLIENPYFAPDASCKFDAYQLHCIPGDSQECPKGFGNNDDGTCFAQGECPDGYHSAQDDESDQCYPDTEPCYPGQIMNPNFPSCDDEQSVCKKYNQTLATSCSLDGRSLVNFSNENCLIGPDGDNCAVLEGYGCPEGFKTMNSTNFTVPRCVPVDYEETQKAQREIGTRSE